MRLRTIREATRDTQALDGRVKKRTIKEKELFRSNDITPPELKLLLWKLNLNSKNLQHFCKVMNLKLKLY